MRIDDIVKLARETAGVYSDANGTRALRLAEAVLGLLAVDAVPCGFDTPRATHDGDVYVGDAIEGWLSVGEARAIAVMLLHAADDAERKDSL